MIGIPEELYSEEPKFVSLDDDLVMSAVRNLLPDQYFSYSIYGIGVDNRLADLLLLAKTYHLSFSEVANIRRRQVLTTMSEFPDADNECLEEYLEFLRSL